MCIISVRLRPNRPKLDLEDSGQQRPHYGRVVISLPWSNLDIVIKSQDWAMGAKKPTHHMLEEQTPNPSTKFEAIHPQPTPSNKTSS